LDNRKTEKKTVVSRFKRLYRAGFQRRRKGESQAAIGRLGLLSGLAVAIASVGLSAANVYRVLELQSYNWLHQVERELAGSPSWSDQIVVIAIDDASVDQFGYFPWPRQSYADLLDQLLGVQPAAIAFNILLPEATSQDEPLAQSIVGSANVVLAVGNTHQDRYLDVSPTIADSAQGFFLKGDAGTPVDEDGVSRRLRLYGKHGVPSLGLATLQVYADTLANTTLANTTSATSVPVRRPHRSVFNRDFFDRSVFAQSFTQPFAAPSAPSAQLPPSPSSSTGSSAVSVVDAVEVDAVDAAVPYAVDAVYPEFSLQDLLPRSGPLWVKWPGEVGHALSSDSAASPGSLQVYSYADVVSGQVDTSLFQNKIVLVGPTLTGVDTLRTPFQSTAPTNGIYFYAATINNLLDRSFLRRPSTWQNFLLLSVLAISATHTLRRQGVGGRLAMVAGFPIVWTMLAYVGFVCGWWLPIAAPVGTVVLSALVVQLQEQREKQQLMALLSMNVSPGTAELIWRHKGQILDRGELSAQDLTATVLFMDIRGFTSIAETLPSQKLLPWLNQYFETMTDCIMEHDGMVDKYIGDAIMAVFGAPVPRSSPDEIRADAIAALQAAVEMHGRLRRLNHQLAAQNLPEIKFGIGIHTGPLVGGTVGNRHRLNYSLFGDTVNVAARLESMTKSLSAAAPFSVLLSASTYEHTRDHFPLEPFQSARLRGRKGQTEVYALASNLRTEASRERADAVIAIEPLSVQREAS